MLKKTVSEREKAIRIADDMTKEITKFKLAVEAASDQIVITDANGVILYANPATAVITGYKIEEIIGKKAGSGELWGGQMPKQFYEQMWHTLKRAKQAFLGELVNKRKNGLYIQQKLAYLQLLLKTMRLNFL